jgi:hypothetical protein
MVITGAQGWYCLQEILSERLQGSSSRIHPPWVLISSRIRAATMGWAGRNGAHLRSGILTMASLMASSSHWR